jgi:hypothetical protein
LEDGVHVQLSSGLRDRRAPLAFIPLAHEPLFWAVSLSLWQLRTKRCSISCGEPVFRSAARARSPRRGGLGDRGSVLFRQTHIGQDGAPSALKSALVPTPKSASST